MNYLDLCRDVARKSGTLSGGPGAISTLLNATGRIEKIANWVQEAWVNVQLEHSDWLWMRADFEKPLAAGVSVYTPEALAIERFGFWVVADDGYLPFSLYETGKGRVDETRMIAVRHDEWRGRYDFGTHDANRPREIAVTPSHALAVGPRPDKAYTLRGVYQRSPQILAVDTDTPDLPPQYHKIIVYEALKLLSADDEAPFTIQTAMAEYIRLRDALSRQERPEATFTMSGFGIA